MRAGAALSLSCRRASSDPHAHARGISGRRPGLPVARRRRGRENVPAGIFPGRARLGRLVRARTRPVPRLLRPVPRLLREGDACEEIPAAPSVGRGAWEGNVRWGHAMLGGHGEGRAGSPPPVSACRRERGAVAPLPLPWISVYTCIYMHVYTRICVPTCIHAVYRCGVGAPLRGPVVDGSASRSTPCRRGWKHLVEGREGAARGAPEQKR